MGTDHMSADHVSTDHTGSTRASSTRMGSTRMIAIAVGVVTALLIGFLAFGKPFSSEGARSTLVGKPAPEIRGLSIKDGSPVSLSALKQGNKFVLVNFFGSYCAPCKLEHPELVTISEKYASDVAILGVMFEDNADDARAFFAANGGSWPVVDAPATAVDYGVLRLPETFLVSPDGVVLYKAAGPITEKGFAKVLAEAKAVS